MKVLVCDGVAQEGIDVLEKELTVDKSDKLSEEELLKVIGDYDAIIVRSGTKVSKAVIEQSKLKVIGRAGVGVDNIDVEAATKKGITVVNAPEGNTIAASEHTIALITSVARNIPQAVSSIKAGKWERSKFVGIELKDKVLGVVGLGRIGRDVAKKATGLGMSVIAYDPYIIKESAENINITITDLDTVFRQADFITFHVPLTESSYHMVSQPQLDMMKSGVILINCARGGILDEEALLKALISGKVAACAIDVFEHEPPLESPLLKLPNVIATPHLGASTAEAQINVAKDVARDILRALRGELVKNPVNMMAIKPEEYKEVSPFVELAEKLGSFYVQLRNGRINQIEMIYTGRIGKRDVKPITTAGLKGILTGIIQDTANMVNASFIAKERGIKVWETKINQDQDAPGVVTMRVTTDRGTGSVSGTVLGESDKRIIAVDEYKIDLIPEGLVLMNFHKDQPGIVGKLGSILGKNDINIAYMQLGRKAYRGEALMAMGIDEDISQEVLAEIRAIESSENAVVVKF